MIAVLTLLVVVTLSIVITRIAAVALTHTGMARQAARFQARSAFPGAGFTTTESEQVVRHPVRRRIVQSGAETGTKVLWVVVILLLPVFGLILWLLFGAK